MWLVLSVSAQQGLWRCDARLTIDSGADLAELTLTSYLPFIPSNKVPQLSITHLYLRSYGAQMIDLDQLLATSRHSLTRLTLNPNIRNSAVDLSSEVVLALVPLASQITWLDLTTVEPNSPNLQQLLPHLTGLKTLRFQNNSQDTISAILSILQCRLFVLNLSSMKPWEGRLTEAKLLELLDLPSLRGLKRLRISQWLQPEGDGDVGAAWRAKCAERGIHVCDQKRYFTGELMSVSHRPATTAYFFTFLSD